MNKIKFVFCMIMTLLFMLLIGCEGTNQAETEPPEPPKPPTQTCAGVTIAGSPDNWNKFADGWIENGNADTVFVQEVEYDDVGERSFGPITRDWIVLGPYERVEKKILDDRYFYIYNKQGGKIGWIEPE